MLRTRDRAVSIKEEEDRCVSGERRRDDEDGRRRDATNDVGDVPSLLEEERVGLDEDVNGFDGRDMLERDQTRGLWSSDSSLELVWKRRGVQENQPMLSIVRRVW